VEEGSKQGEKKQKTTNIKEEESRISKIFGGRGRRLPTSKFYLFSKEGDCTE